MPPPVKFVAACAGTMAFLYQFENCMTATALPVMCVDVKHLAGVVSLVPAAYLVAAAVAIVPAGRLAVRIGFHLMLTAALGTMALGALICWLSVDAVTLLAGRWVQGLGGGAMAASAYSMVAVCVSAEERRGVLGWVSMGAGMGMVVGTPVGGAVAEFVSWRALFAVQIPLLIVIALFMSRTDFGKGGAGKVSLGLARSLIVGLGAACICVAGSLGRESGWFSPGILSLQAAAVLIFVGFALSERRVAEPLFPLEIWKAGDFWRSWMLVFASSTALGASIFLIPFYLHEVALLSVAAAAAWMILQVASYSMAAMNSARLQKFMSVGSQGLLGALVALAGISIFATHMIREGNLAAVAIGCAVVGLGFGLMSPAAGTNCVARLPEAQRNVGAPLLPLGINLGSVTGVIAAAELREWHLGVERISVDYEQAFLVVLVALAVAGTGFWRLGRSRSPAST